MEDERIVAPGVAASAASGDDSPENLLDQLAQKRKTINETKETYIPVPGYDENPPLLLARYRLLDGAELSRIGDKIQRDVKGRWDRQVYASIDTFIAACMGFFVDKGDGKPVPLVHQGEPITGYTQALAEALQYAGEVPDGPDHVIARAVAFGLFVNNDVAISEHAFRLNRWFSNTSIDVSQGFLGNL